MNPMQIKLPSDFQYLGSARDFIDDIHEIFAATPLLQTLDLDETSMLCNFMDCYTAPRGTVLLRQGEPGEFMIFVLTGSAEVTITDEYGEAHRVGVVRSGAPAGHMSMIDGQPRFASCVALDPVDLVVLPKDAFNEILITLPRLGNKLMLVMLHGLSDRLEAAQRQLLQSYPPATSSKWI